MAPTVYEVDSEMTRKRSSPCGAAGIKLNLSFLSPTASYEADSLSRVKMRQEQLRTSVTVSWSARRSDAVQPGRSSRSTHRLGTCDSATDALLWQERNAGRLSNALTNRKATAARLRHRRRRWRWRRDNLPRVAREIPLRKVLACEHDYAFLVSVAHMSGYDSR